MKCLTLHMMNLYTRSNVLDQVVLIDVSNVVLNKCVSIDWKQSKSVSVCYVEEAILRLFGHLHRI